MRTALALTGSPAAGFLREHVWVRCILCHVTLDCSHSQACHVCLTSGKASKFLSTCTFELSIHVFAMLLLRHVEALCLLVSLTHLLIRVYEMVVCFILFI